VIRKEFGEEKGRRRRTEVLESIFVYSMPFIQYRNVNLNRPPQYNNNSK
jgi:hypothetical protein